jgi:hypothetical protein
VGTGTIFIGGVALGVNQDNYVTVAGNPIITINTAGNLTIQGDVSIGTVQISDTAPTATTGTQWFNTIDGRTYIAYNGQWVDASPTVVPTPDTYLDEITIDGSIININDNTLTISNTGTLLVNGAAVTGGGVSVSNHIEYTDTATDYVSTLDLTYDFAVDVDNAHLDINGDGNWEIGSTNFDTKIFSINDPGNEPKVIVVRADDEDWTFGPLGMLTLPQGSIISEAMGAISLRPANASSSTQALLIYPTVVDGNHVHLTAGGGETDLYLGNDDQFVKIDHGGDIVVGTYSTATTSTWTFGTDGVLTLPNDMTIDASVSFGIVTIGGTSTYISIDNGGAPPALTIATNQGENAWQFGSDGNLTTPSNLVIGPRPGGGSHIQQNDAALEIVGEGANSVVQIGWTANQSEPDSVALIAMNYPNGGEGNILFAVGNNATTVNYWLFDNTGTLTLPAGGDIKNSSGTSVLTVVTGQETYEFDGVNTTLTITNVTFNLLFCTAAVGYSGSDGHTVLLPAGTAGQRLVIVNISSLCTLTVDGAIDGAVNVAPEGTAELIYLVGAGVTGWWPLYGTTLVT